MRTSVSLALLLAVGAFGVACTAPPPPPTAEQHLDSVNTNLAARDYEAALKNLDRVIKAAGQPPQAQEGRALRIALLTAIAEGRKEMAEAYAAGRKESLARERQTDFIRVRADYYKGARDRLVPAMEGFLELRAKLVEAPIGLNIDFPGFSGSEPDALDKIRRGMWVSEDERYRAELYSIRNALARILTRLAGAEDNLHKGQEIFQQGNVQVKPCRYLVEMSHTLVDVGGIFERGALDDARFRRISYEIARDNIETAMELMGTEPDKELLAKAKKVKTACEKSLKAFDN